MCSFIQNYTVKNVFFFGEVNTTENNVNNKNNIIYMEKVSSGKN